LVLLLILCGSFVLNKRIIFYTISCARKIA
jgi:hypothetical protein